MLAGILRAFGNSKSPFYILIICGVVNIAGDLLLVGVFRTGVAGAAAATVAAQFISVVLAMRSLTKTYPGGAIARPFRDGSPADGSPAGTSPSGETFPRGSFRLRKDIGHMLAIGFPLGLQGILFPVANSIIHAQINKMGTEVIAAWAVCGKLDLLIWLVADAMSPALSTFVSQNLGAGKSGRVVRGSLTGAGFSVAVVALISLCLFLFPGPLGGLFVTAEDHAVLAPMIIHFMRMMAPFYLFYALAEAFSGACCGTGDTVRPMIVTLLCTCGLRVASILLILPHFGTMDCIVWIYIASWIVTGLAFSGMFAYKARRLP